MRHALLSIGLFLVLLSTPRSYAIEPVNITIDMSSTGKQIENKFSDINMWAIRRSWIKTANSYPKDYFKKNFPFVERIQLMAATGGNKNRDLFADPNNSATTTDYEFGRLIQACEIMVANGLTPMIKTGWVPLKLSDEPQLSSSFQTNLRPPKDYEAYYAYIKAIAEALKQRFGLEEMRKWSWGVGVEYENKEWFADGKNAERTKQAYFKLYDFTVAALKDALGAENFTIGAHSMTIHEGHWDEREFIEHCARGTNSLTKEIGTKLDFLAISYYTEVPGFDESSFLKAINTVRTKAIQVGLSNLKYGIDEGRVVNGWDQRILYPREVQHPIQAVSDAKLYHLMLTHDIDYFSTWYLTTKGHFGGIPVVSANFRNLAFRMAGSSLLDTKLSGRPMNIGNEVNALACFDPEQGILRIMAYNFNRAQGARGSEKMIIRIEHASPTFESNVIVRTWRLDSTHGNWWKMWQKDVRTRKMRAEAFNSSRWTICLPDELSTTADIDFWNSRQVEYGKAGTMKCSEERAIMNPDGSLLLQRGLNAHEVVLFEILPVDIEKTTRGDTQKYSTHSSL